MLFCGMQASLDQCYIVLKGNSNIYKKKSTSLQCFDAVGWAAGRASGL